MSEPGGVEENGGLSSFPPIIFYANRWIRGAKREGKSVLMYSAFFFYILGLVVYVEHIVLNTVF